MDIKEKYNIWLEHTAADAVAQAQLQEMQEDAVLLEDAFYKDLEFGTAGLRATLGTGSNRMNLYVVGRATQGLANFLLGKYKREAIGKRGVAIAYDSRRMSAEFAREAACVLAANGIVAYLYEDIRSVPQLSFTVRTLNALAGIVITASHNPPEYNGYKVFDATGCQLSVADSLAVTDCIEALNLFADVRTLDFDTAKAREKIYMLGAELDEQFYAALKKLPLHTPEELRQLTAGFKVVYTPLHGCGLLPVTHMLAEIGADVQVVPQQAQPDGDFPTVKYPNPEDPAAFALAMELGAQVGASLLLATDPDSDRLGAAVWDGQTYKLLTGNQIGCLLLYYKLEMLRRRDALPPNGFVVRSIVSSPLCDAICAAYNVECKHVLTGFRYIGGAINDMEAQGYTFLFGYEESYGFCLGDHVRDKDAVGAATVLCEMAADYARQGKTLLDVVEGMADTFGAYCETVGSFTLQGIAGMQAIAGAMEGLRRWPWQDIDGICVAVVTDYLLSLRTANGESQPVDLPPSNVLLYELENGWSVCVRPSGTEPKLKYYIFVHAKAMADAQGMAERVRDAVDQLLKIRLGIA